jgi:hypothetical protein
MEILRKKIALQLFVILCLGSSYAQTSFYRIFSGSGYDKAEGIAQLADSTYIVTGSSSSFQNAPSQALLLKLDKNGFHQWSKVYGGSEFEVGRRVLPVENVGYYVCGTSSSNNHAFDGYVIFTDLMGNLIWEKWYDINNSWERINDALLLPDTSILLLGETTNTPDQLSDRLMIRIDKNGSVHWQQQLNTLGNDFLQKGVLLNDSTVVVAGTQFNSDSLQNKAYIAAFRTNGMLVWDTLTGKNGNYWLNDVQLIAGNFIAAGEKIQNGKTDKDDYTIFITNYGLVYAEYDYYAAYDSRIVGFVNYKAFPGNKIFSGGQSNDPNFTFPSGEDFILSRCASAYYWDGYGKSYSGVGQDQMNHIIQTKDSFAICVGFHSDEGFSPGGNSLFVLKLGSDSNFPSDNHSTIYSILSLEETSENVAQVSIYPNPVGNEFTILSEQEIQQLEVVDALGQPINFVYINSHTIDTQNWKSGVYFLKIQVNNQQYTKKICKQ